MRINNNLNNQSFTGIKLSKNSTKTAIDTIFRLEDKGYEYLGDADVYASNEINKKILAVKNIRDWAGIEDNEFASITLPWSNEKYILATPKDEQKMYKFVKQVDRDAKINLLI